ncbi:MAG: hypothetical protein AB7E55_09025 [Pigmentiphaga sp.]
MDLALQATWYDLDPESRDTYLEWLHEVGLPRLAARDGYSWVAHYEVYPSRVGAMDKTAAGVVEIDDLAVGNGSRYLLMIGAASADVFFDRRALQYPVADEEADQAWLQHRRGARTCVYLEEARVNGHDYHLRTPGRMPARIIQFGSFNARTPDDEFELGAWYRQNRLPAVARTQGCIGVRKLVAIAGPVKHGVLYEFASVEARRDHFEGPLEWGTGSRTAASDSPYLWPGRDRVDFLYFAPGSPTVAKRIWPLED